MGGLVSTVGFGLHSPIAVSKINGAESFPLAPVSLMERKLHGVTFSHLWHRADDDDDDERDDRCCGLAGKQALTNSDSDKQPVLNYLRFQCREWEKPPKVMVCVCVLRVCVARVLRLLSRPPLLSSSLWP